MKRPQPKRPDPRSAELQARLAEAEETLRAIRSGEVDALLVTTAQGEQVFTLKGAETTYRFLIEAMNEGALLLGDDGTVLYANARFAHLVNVPLDQVIGSTWERFFVRAEQPFLERLLPSSRTGPLRRELHLQVEAGRPTPVSVSLNSLRSEQVEGYAIVVTDLTERKAAEARLQEANEKLEARVTERTAQLTHTNELLLVEMGERKRTEDEVRRQQEWLQVTLASIGDAVVACDKSGHITFMNPVAGRLCGWEPEGARGQPFATVFRIINEKTGEPVEDIVGRVLRYQRVVGLASDSVLVAKTGRTTPIQDSAAPILDPAGQVTGVVLVFQDATRRRHAEEALRQSEQRLLLAQRAGRVGVFDWDLATNDMVWTPQLEEIFGLPPGGFEGRYEAWMARVHPEDLPALEEHLREWLASDRQAAEWEHRIVRRGEERWIAARGQVFRDARGKPLRMLGTEVDVTERKQAEAVLARNRGDLEKLVVERTAKLQEMISELQHVSYAMVHDMRAPLRAVQGFATFLEQEAGESSPAQLKEYCRRIVAGAKRIDLQITDALQYTRAVLQQVPMQQVSLGKLMSSILEGYPNLSPKKAVIRIEGDLPQVLGNESLLTQCFSNLLGNAVKFVAPRTRPSVRIHAEANKDTARIWIEDNGIGIPKYAQGRLFGMFERLSSGYEGTGVGLAIVRKVVERMGGKVGVESEEGKGSRFWVELRTPKGGRSSGNSSPAKPA